MSRRYLLRLRKLGANSFLKDSFRRKIKRFKVVAKNSKLLPPTLSHVVRNYDVDYIDEELLRNSARKRVYEIESESAIIEIEEVSNPVVCIQPIRAVLGPNIQNMDYTNNLSVAWNTQL